MGFGPFTKQDHLEITTLGMEFAVSEILCTAGGYWLDKKWGTFPWCLIGGAVVGFALGLYQIIRAARNMAQPDRKFKKVEKKDGRC